VPTRQSHSKGFKLYKIKCYDSEKDYCISSDDSPINKKEERKSETSTAKKRCKYRMISVEEKAYAIDLAKKMGVKIASQECNVPVKSLKRWLLVGWERKKGGGRKTKDPEMERKLHEWYLDLRSRNEIITGKMVKEKAIEFSNCEDFLGSKGWLDKFKQRYQLKLN
jgi:hypothetical protein